jgi:glycosyltransferase involved in cell wall biosynthesis
MTNAEKFQEISISIVLPAHNEADNLKVLLPEIKGLLDSLKSDYEIIVVNGTQTVAEGFAQSTKRVSVINHPKNKGYGAALTTGFKNSTKKLVFFMDSDRQFQILDLTKLLPYVDSFDIVAGYRIERKDPWYRVMIGRTYNLLVITLFGVKLKDIDCAFKIYHREVLDNIQFETIGALVNTEIMLKAQIMGKTVKEVGVNHYPRTAGKQSGAKPQVIIRAFFETIGLWWKYRAPWSKKLVTK